MACDATAGIKILVVTEKAVYQLRGDRELAPDEVRIQRGTIRCATQGVLFSAVGTSQGEVQLIRPNGIETLCAGIREPIECLLILSEDPPELLVGTESARLYRATDGHAQAIESFDALDCRSNWRTPWGGPPSVRSLAAAPEDRIYADIHVGSIMRSSDNGKSWQAVQPDLDDDVHQVATCNDAPKRVYANTARGVYVSDDCGDSWTHRADDLNNRYGRAIAVAPNDPDLLLASVSDGPHGENVHGQLYRSEDCGKSWTHFADGFPDSTAENINTYHIGFSWDGRAWALAGGALHMGARRATTWEPLWSPPQAPIMIATHPDG